MDAATISTSLPVALGAAYVGGLLTAATPCVYPLIPVTVSLFGAKKGVSRMRGAGLSGLYVLGIATMYTALGLVAASTGAVFGAIMANPWVLGVVGLVFGGLALGLLGVYQLQLPYSLQQRLTRVGGEGPLGAFLMGLVAGIIAAPCTGPMLAAILTFVATSGSMFKGGTLMFVYALGMGTPFFLLGAFATRLPKAGGWLHYVEGALGIVLIATALYLMKDVVAPLRNALQPQLWFLGIAAAVVALGVGLGAVHLHFQGSSTSHKVRKLGGAAIAAFGLYLIAGSVTVSASEGPSWRYDATAAVAEARAAGRPVMIDFWASWCAACNELDRDTYPDPDIIAESWRFVSVKVDATEQSDLVKALSTTYEVKGLPTVVFLDSSGNVMASPRFTGWVDPPTMLSAMRTVR